ncbi:MAG: hypothetical protein WDO14_22555 [Bacteroidota bacterium]
MRKASILIVVLAAICFQGCIVKSIHPFYKEADVFYNPILEGNWSDQDKNKWRIHKNPFKSNAYELHYSKNNRDVAFSGHLFTINDQLYIDMTPAQDNSEDMPVYDVHLLPTHSIAKIDKLTKQEVVIKWFDDEWLYNMFVENRIKIRHEFIADEDSKTDGDGMYLLTASTDELQSFIEKYGNDDRAFDSDLRLYLTK